MIKLVKEQPFLCSPYDINLQNLVLQLNMGTENINEKVRFAVEVCFYSALRKP